MSQLDLKVQYLAHKSITTSVVADSDNEIQERCSLVYIRSERSHDVILEKHVCLENLENQLDQMVRSGCVEYSDDNLWRTCEDLFILRLPVHLFNSSREDNEEKGYRKRELLYRM